MIRTLTLTALLAATSAGAESRYVFEHPAMGFQTNSFVQITPLEDTEDGAVALVQFHNERVHEDNVVFDIPIEIDGISVIVEFKIGAMDLPDRMAVFPPDGYYAVPSSLLVDEEQSGFIRIIPGVYVGM